MALIAAHLTRRIVRRSVGQTVRMGFFDRNRDQLVAKGYSPARLPKGQYLTDRFPVLHVGDVPTYEPGEWDLTINGLVDHPFTIGLDELQAMPSVSLTFDIHCVTKWSKFDTTWTGVRVRDLLARAGVQRRATHVLEHAEYGYTTNLPLAEALKPDVLLVHTFDGAPLEVEHGGPCRVITPQLYAWKGAKWIKGLELMTEDRLGFWEERGYSNTAYPWRNDRYS